MSCAVAYLWGSPGEDRRAAMTYRKGVKMGSATEVAVRAEIEAG
jgi:hypothetical protein